jgi:serine/threonine protein phosphatase PrpC
MAPEASGAAAAVVVDAPRLTLEVSVLSRAGLRETNEDACGVWSQGVLCFAMLCDGAGGHGAGDVAARLAVRQALTLLQQRPAAEADALHTALQAANRALLAAQRQSPQQARMRCTAVLLAIDTRRAQAVWAHLGDSRLYCFRRGLLVARTRDHSVVQQMVDAGYLRPSELRQAPERSKLLGALGDPDGIEPAVQAEPLALQAGDAFLLCSDGCWEPVEEGEMAADLDAAQSAQEWLQRVEARILARADARQDNYSAVAVRILAGG